MKKLLTTILFIYTSALAYAQQNLQGMIMDEAGTPLKYATVSLLKPEDSTLAFFGISNASGVFQVKDVKEGKYLLQAAILSYSTYYKNITVPMANGGDLGTIFMEQKGVQMDGVEIVAEKIPMLINNDTIDYNAGAFKTKPDANVEELLKKLPGVQVDRAGNIKAQGERVSKVFVDGKEFFGSDPKVATRNLPADAINKVQVFDKKSDAAEFTGIDDGTREKTINLKLKDDKKNGYFGDVLAGGGTNERFKASGKLYKFSPKTQFGALGMFNNINRSGFSFSDYLNFSGGIQSLISGGGRLEISGDDQMPIDFGQPVTGIVTSGAGGINYSYEPKKNKRIGISYLGNGADKKVNERTYSQNFTNTEDYTSNSERDDNTREYAHRLNLNLRNDLDSQRQIMLSAKGKTSRRKFNSFNNSVSRVEDVIFNRQNSTDLEQGNTVGGNANMSFTNTSKSRDDVFRISANGSYKHTMNEEEWNNVTQFLGQSQTLVNNQFRDDKLYNYDYNGTASWTHAIGKLYYLSADVDAGSDVQHLIRKQGLPANETVVIDTLSPDYSRTYTSITPGVTFRKATRQVQYSLGARYEQGILEQGSRMTNIASRNYGYILPTASWRNQYGRGKHVELRYRTSVNAPNYQQLMPAPVATSPLSVYYGNPNLSPEYEHNASANWMVYDQFTFSSFFASISGGYTHDKISRAVTINNANLSQISTVMNVPDDYNARLNLQYGTPIRNLGIKGEVSFSEKYNRGITLVNDVQNITTGYTHELTLKLGNRKKEKWDIEVGGSISLTDVRYSVQQSMNNVYYNTAGFAELSYRPNDRWYFALSGDVTRYDARSFQSAVTIPLLRSEVSYYFLKANRGVLTLEGFDLLNQNKGLRRISQQNYLAEVRSNIIGQYFMLSFKYRINRAGKAGSGGVIQDINVNIR